MSRENLSEAMKQTRSDAEEKIAAATANTVEAAPEVTTSMKEYLLCIDLLEYRRKEPNASDKDIDRFVTRREMEIDANPEQAAKYTKVEANEDKYKSLTKDQQAGVDYICLQSMCDYTESNPKASPQELMAVYNRTKHEVLGSSTFEERLPEYVAEAKKVDDHFEKLDKDDKLTSKIEKKYEKLAKKHGMDPEDLDDTLYSYIAMQHYNEVVKEAKAKETVQKMSSANIVAMMNSGLRR